MKKFVVLMIMFSSLSLAQIGSANKDTVYFKYIRNPNGSLTILGNSLVSGSLTLNGALNASTNPITSGAITSSGGITSNGGLIQANASINAYIRINNTGAPANQKMYDWVEGTDGTLSLRAVNDAYSAVNNVLKVTRTGYSVTGLTIYPATTFNSTITVNGTGTSSIAGPVNFALQGSATIGAGDSVQVSITNLTTATGNAVISYKHDGPVVADTTATFNVTSAGTLTLFGKFGWVISYFITHL